MALCSRITPWLGLLASCLIVGACATPQPVVVAVQPPPVGVRPAGIETTEATPQDTNGGCLTRVIAGHQYTICRDSLDWESARARCVAMGGELASVGSDYENASVALLVELSGGGPALIGMSDAAREGTFVNVDGSPSSTSAWLPGEPNDAGGEDCVEIGTDGGWNDIPCSGYARAYVCEESSPCTVEVIGDSLYHFCRRPGDWMTARDLCRRLGADLAVPESAAETAALAARFGASIDVAHIGLTDAQIEGRFATVNGAEATYQNWAAGEPNDAGQGEDCASLLINGQWNDIPCAEYSLSSFICETPRPCVSRWFQGHRYLFCLRPINGAQARESCLQENGDLATVETAEEDAFLYRTIAGFHRARFFIGLNDEQQEGTFVWRTGAPVEYSHWNQGEPNNQDEEDCVEIIEGGVWNDISCTQHERNGYVCEFP